MVGTQSKLGKRYPVKAFETGERDVYKRQTYKRDEAEDPGAGGKQEQLFQI